MKNLIKVTRNYQITIPADVRRRLNINEGDFIEIVYDESEGVAKIIPVKRKRTTVKLGRKISVEEMEKIIEEVLNEATS